VRPQRDQQCRFRRLERFRATAQRRFRLPVASRTRRSKASSFTSRASCRDYAPPGRERA
jgi:hypothetical protein